MAARLQGARGAALLALVIALAGPRTGTSIVDMDADGIAIAIALDISSSMLAEDFAPNNRLEVAQENVKAFVHGREYDRIGLIAFAGEALTQVPITVSSLNAGISTDTPGQPPSGCTTASRSSSNRKRRPPAIHNAAVHTG